MTFLQSTAILSLVRYAQNLHSRAKSATLTFAVAAEAMHKHHGRPAPGQEGDNALSRSTVLSSKGCSLLAGIGRLVAVVLVADLVAVGAVREVDLRHALGCQALRPAACLQCSSCFTAPSSATATSWTSPHIAERWQSRRRLRAAKEQARFRRAGLVSAFRTEHVTRFRARSRAGAVRCPLRRSKGPKNFSGTPRSEGWKQEAWKDPACSVSSFDIFFDRNGISRSIVRNSSESLEGDAKSSGRRMDE
eukprot:scaffold805_cov251-Pinguiococcus_pyrenoidosus.AAC.6